LHVPVPILVRVGFANMKAFVGAGPYVSFGVGGKVETEGDIVGFDFGDDGSISWGDDNGDTYRSTDSGLVLTGGIEYSGIQLALSYELGLANIAPNGDEDNITRNRTLSLTATYFFFD
ncbi:MAG: outer membrane beta-barrel protein, partial [Bacteroidota bacterium]